MAYLEFSAAMYELPLLDYSLPTKSSYHSLIPKNHHFHFHCHCSLQRGHIARFSDDRSIQTSDYRRRQRWPCWSRRRQVSSQVAHTQDGSPFLPCTKWIRLDEPRRRPPISKSEFRPWTAGTAQREHDLVQDSPSIGYLDGG